MVGGPGPLGRIGVGGPGGEVHAGPGHLQGVVHVDDPVLDHLERGDGSVEDHPPLAYSTASSRARSDTPTSSAASPTATSSRTRRHRPLWSPSGPSGSTGSSSRTRRDSLRVGSSPGTASALGARQQERPDPLLGQGHHDGPVGGVAVDHDRLVAGHHPARPLAPGPGPHRGQRVAVTLLVQGHRPPAGARGQAGEQAVGPEGPGGQRGHDRGGEEGAGQRDPAHLLEDDAHLEEAGPLPGDQHPGPAQRHQAVPELGGHPGRVVGQLPQGVAPHLAHGPPGHVLQGELFGIEREIHSPPPEWHRRTLAPV